MERLEVLRHEILYRPGELETLHQARMTDLAQAIHEARNKVGATEVTVSFFEQDHGCNVLLMPEHLRDQYDRLLCAVIAAKERLSALEAQAERRATL